MEEILSLFYSLREGKWFVTGHMGRKCECQDWNPLSDLLMFHMLFESVILSPCPYLLVDISWLRSQMAPNPRVDDKLWVN